MQNSSPLFSVIVPIYGVEKYLPQCINSILNQSFEDFELILVDDGSPDRCPIICDELATKDSRIKVLHKPNGGLSDARNAGLKFATGEYVAFIDGDDFWIDEKQLETLMTIVNKNNDCDFIGFNCSYYYPKTDTYKKWIEYAKNYTNDKDVIIQKLVASGTFPMSAWSKIIKREFLLDNNLFFKLGQLSEDIPWFINLLNKCKKCKFVNLYMYAYRQNVAGSITQNFPVKHFDDLLDIIKTELKNIDTYNFNTDTKKALLSFLAYEFSILLSKIHRLDKIIQNAKRKELMPYKWLLEYTLNPKVKKVAIINKLFGIRVTEYVLKTYDCKK